MYLGRYIIPSDYTLRIVKRPAALREPRKPITHFKLVTPMEQPDLGEGNELALFVAPDPGPGEPEVPDPKAKGKEKGGKKGKAEPDPEEPPKPQRVTQYRWVVPAKGAVHVVVQYRSPEIGKHNQIAAFDVLGGDKNNSVVLYGLCVYPTISTDYRNVFFRKVKTRPQSPLVNRQYIINKGTFEFGPLLAGKPSEGWNEGKHPNNCARMRITNNGHFDLHVEFKLKSAMPAEGEEGKKVADKKGKKGGDKKGGAADNSEIILLDPPEMDIKVDETQELYVYGFPKAVGPVEDAVMAIIADNPTPAEFPVALAGDTPKVEIDLEIDDKGNCKGIAFDRLLLDKTDTIAFRITNVCLLPVAWKLAGVEELPEELTIVPDSGVLNSRSTVEVNVQFRAIVKRMLSGKVTLQIQDVDAVLPETQKIIIPVVGEAYKIEVDVKFPQEGINGIDFGTVKVVDDLVKQVAIRNTGKYEIGYNFNVRRAWVADLFTISPAKGVIAPGGKSPTVISFHFNQAHQLRKEITLANANDITMSIIETATDAVEEVVPVRISARAMFNKYSITPARGINFGPHTYNTTSNPRSFAVTNQGEFDFDFNLFKYSDGLPKEASSGSGKAPPPPAAKAPPPPAGKGGKSAPPPKPASSAAPPGGQFELGPFKFEPASGTVPPGGSVQVQVVFKAEGSATYTETLGIHITDRDFEDQPEGIPYEVTGESCIPGIITDDTAGIFEEHNICTSLDPFLPVSFEFATRDKIFNFGAVIADLSSPSGPDQAMDIDSAGGVRANLKISNPIKVPCTVNFAIKARGAGETEETGGNAVPGKGGKKAGAGAKTNEPQLEPGFPMEVHPKKLDIPPHEYRYVTVYFAPKAIKSFAAMFEAVVENGGDPATRRFTCELRGEGTLPTLTLEEPVNFNEAGQPCITFPRLLRGKKALATILLKNNGIIPATGRLDFTNHPVCPGQTACLGVASCMSGRQLLLAEGVAVSESRGLQLTVSFSPSPAPLPKGVQG